MLEISNINVSFRSERQEKLFGTTRDQVLFDVSLKVPQGTCLGILGESGSGKSTLGRVICGLLKPDSGELKIHGTSVYASRSGRKNLQKRLSVVFQDYTTSANPRFRVKEIIAEGLAARERNQKIRLNQAEETSRLLELVGLNASYADRYPHELSGGQLQRVCIARAVACQPEIILFDEAISSLDAHTQVQIMDLLRELKEKLDKEKLLHDTKVIGLDIVELKGYTSSGVALSACRLIGSIVRNEKSVVPVSTVVSGQYGMNGVAMSLPCVISKNGIDRILEVPLDEEGKRDLKKCYHYLKSTIESVYTE